MKKRSKILILILAPTILLVSFLLLVFSKRETFFSLKGNNSITINIDQKYKDEGYTAKYCTKFLHLFCKDISSNVKITSTEDNNIYNYNIIYTLKYGNTSKELKREVKVKDIESPNIELVENNEELCENQEYVEPGYKAIDNIDGDITDKVVVEKKDNKVFYTVSDSSGNKKVTIRTIKYGDSVKPSIILTGGELNYVYINTDFTERGYKANDNCDGDITDKVKVISNIDTSKEGNYEITYNVSDSKGNTSTQTRKVVVYSDTSAIPKNGKTVYLTFDDGPGPYTDDILDILKRYNIKATFFVTNQFSNYKNLINREYSEGHTVAIHTYSHKFKEVYSSLDAYLNDFNNMNQIVYEETGNYSKIFRFPGGSSNTISKFNPGIVTAIANKMTELGYTYFDWNVDSNDTGTKDPNTIYQNVIREIEKRNSSVVLMHDIKKANIESTQKIIEYGLNNGFTFLPLTESSPVTHHHINN